MARSIETFNNLQMAIEGTAGTDLAATFKYVGAFQFQEDHQAYVSPYPQGYRGPTDDAGTLVRQMMSVKAQSELTFEELPTILMAAVRGSVAAVGAGPYVYTWDPQITISNPTLANLTGECVLADGTTNHYISAFHYGFVPRFGISIPDGPGACMFNYDVIGRARQSETPTAALAAITGRQVAVRDLATVYIDTAYGSLGGTQITGIVRSLEYEFSAGLLPAHYLDARSDLDFTSVIADPSGPNATLKLMMELNATSAAYLGTYWRARAKMYVRFKITGTSSRYIQVDGGYIVPPAGRIEFSSQGGVIIAAIPLQSVRGNTNKTVGFEVSNSLATIT